MMETWVRKWGSSLAVRIPKAFAIEAGMQADSPVQIALVDGKLVVTPVGSPARSLEQLLAQVSDAGLHREVGTGPAVGHEAW